MRYKELTLNKSDPPFKNHYIIFRLTPEKGYPLPIYVFIFLYQS